ncbi:hypothetical protein [Blastococcus sp. PRF04-17]|uniref:hypothetical protein n=1 Tax=Blastococcus sp. PRF04-17 TaxID=2933797 RepID=UPI001FF38439|nr:hypothetical protein [Blastococcus sp. PRF04-17]UOY03874.1 hypothetical protein MVA48_11350 [Blastococcus sp. PRF04-17]
MTASLFATGTSVPTVARGLRAVAHAVARPVVDGLDASVCGVLVTAAAGRDWPSASDGERCEECARIAG